MSARKNGPLAPLHRHRLADEALHALRQGICSGAIPAGKPVAQRVVAGQLGVSQGPIRDAFAVLEREGLVRRTATNRMIVTEMSRDDVRDVLQVRAALEILIVRLAAENATEQDLKSLRDNIRATKKSKSADETITLDVTFHELLIQAGKNCLLLTVWRTLTPQVEMLMRRMMNLPQHTHHTAVRAHAGLLDLIAQRDAERATRFVEAQMAAFLEASLELCELDR